MLPRRGLCKALERGRLREQMTRQAVVKTALRNSLQRAEQRQQGEGATATRSPVPGAVKQSEIVDSELLEQIGERIAAGETVAVTGVQPLQTDTVDVQQAATGANIQVQPRFSLQQVAGESQQSVPATGITLPRGGQPLPPAAAATATQVTAELPPNAVAAQTQQPPVAKGLQQAAANRPQVELPQQVALTGQPQLEIPAGKTLESALPEAIRVAATLESPTAASPGATNTTLSALTAPAAVPATQIASGTAPLDAASPRPVISINTPLGEQGWAQEVGTRLRVLVEQGNQRAEIRLNPPELGSVEVKVVSDGERTNVTFFAQHSTTREALDAAMPRLREMFGEKRPAACRCQRLPTADYGRVSGRRQKPAAVQVLAVVRVRQSKRAVRLCELSRPTAWWITISRVC